MVNQKISAHQKILKEIEVSNQEELKTSPVVKWAQSKSEISVNFKLSHRQDSPPCADIRSANFKVFDIPIVSCPFEI